MAGRAQETTCEAQDHVVKGTGFTSVHDVVLPPKSGTVHENCPLLMTVAKIPGTLFTGVSQGGAAHASSLNPAGTQPP